MPSSVPVTMNTRVGKVALWKPVAAAAVPIQTTLEGAGVPAPPGVAATASVTEAQKNARLLLSAALLNAVADKAQAPVPAAPEAAHNAPATTLLAAELDQRLQMAHDALLAANSQSRAIVCGSRVADSVRVECFPLSTAYRAGFDNFARSLSVQFSVAATNANGGGNVVAYVQAVSVTRADLWPPVPQ